MYIYMYIHMTYIYILYVFARFINQFISWRHHLVMSCDELSRALAPAQSLVTPWKAVVQWCFCSGWGLGRC